MCVELCQGTVIGVTGSDGKTTTTTLIHEIIKAKGYNCFLGGNIGTPLFTRVNEMTPDDIVIAEAFLKKEKGELVEKEKEKYY